jgi:hypothetical protein
VALHLDFWTGFGIIGSESGTEVEDAILSVLPEDASLADEYFRVRQDILKGAARICLSRREAWLKEVETNLEERYGYGKSIVGTGAGSNIRI